MFSKHPDLSVPIDTWFASVLVISFVFENLSVNKPVSSALWRIKAVWRYSAIPPYCFALKVGTSMAITVLYKACVGLEAIQKLIQTVLCCDEDKPSSRF